MAQLCRYRVYCETEEAYQFVSQYESEGIPTECPNDSGHTITAAATALLWKLERPDEAGQVMYALDTLEVIKVLPITNDYGWMVNEDGLHIVNG